MKVLLFTPGLGLLRWGKQLDYISYSYWEPPELVCYYPPLRRWGIWVWSRLHWLLRAGGWYRVEYIEFESNKNMREWVRVKFNEFVYKADYFVYNMDDGFPEDYL